MRPGADFSRRIKGAGIHVARLNAEHCAVIERRQRLWPHPPWASAGTRVTRERPSPSMDRRLQYGYVYFLAHYYVDRGRPK